MLRHEVCVVETKFLALFIPAPVGSKWPDSRSDHPNIRETNYRHPLQIGLTGPRTTLGEATEKNISLQSVNRIPAVKITFSNFIDWSVSSVI